MIYLGSDHAGFDLKEQVKSYLSSHDLQFEDLGDVRPDPNDDYPDFGFLVAEKVQANGGAGILSCESAGGMTIVANKVKGIRAVECSTPLEAHHARTDNDADILVLSHMTVTDPAPILEAWFNTNFSDEERHKRRLQKIADYENEHLS